METWNEDTFIDTMGENVVFCDWCKMTIDMMIGISL